MKIFITTLTLIYILFPAAFAQVEMGYGFYQSSQNFSCLSDQQREEIQARLKENIQRLRQQGRLPEVYSAETVLFDWPVAGAPGFSDYGYHGISNFVDQDPVFPNQILDYNCGDRTYDLSSGYNHQGIDYFNWPFLWYKMDHDQVIVAAAGPGTIIFKQDGNYDRNCEFTSDPWNAVFLQHADGSVTWYGHMKNGSLTQKTVGDTVEVGEFLGVVGSSGSSTGPHLHFEVHDPSGDLIEPYQGPCNILNSISWWIDQRPYYDSAINKLMTHSAPPVFPQCPQQEILNEKNHFLPPEIVYTAAYYRDQLSTQTSQYTIYRPDGTIFQTWTHSSNAPHYSASYWYWGWALPGNAPQGQWTFEAVYEGETYRHNFTISLTGISSDRQSIPRKYALFQNYPNPFNPSTRIRFEIPQTALVTLKVYDALGRQVAALVNKELAPGSFEAEWDGEDYRSGIYYYRLTAGKFSSERQMLLLR